MVWLLDRTEFFDDLRAYLEHDAVATVGAFAGGEHGGERFAAAWAAVSGLHAGYWSGAVGTCEFLATSGALESHVENLAGAITGSP